MAWFALQSNYKDKGALCRLQTAKYISGSTSARKEIIPIPDPVSCFDTVESYVRIWPAGLLHSGTPLRKSVPIQRLAGLEYGNKISISQIRNLTWPPLITMILLGRD